MEVGEIVTKPKLQGIGFGTEWQAEDIEETLVRPTGHLRGFKAK